MKLWDKGKPLDKDIEKFTVGDDYLLDGNLLYWDAVASIAHAMMLEKIGVLSDNECVSLKQALNEIISLHEEGGFTIRPEDEDCHTAIESYLTAKLGEAGKKIHTGRSRNDQVLAALRLYMKSSGLLIAGKALSLAKAFYNFGKGNGCAMPGYTHMRQAMPSTVSLWAGSFSEALLEDSAMLLHAIDAIDVCPLGTAAGYGSPIPLDMEYTAKALGFAGHERNSLHAQSSRGKSEAILLSALSAIALDLNKAATDILLFSMPEFGYFTLPDEICTGSSIMPQKKNPDVLELVRAKSKAIIANANLAFMIPLDLPSGYNRDFQEAKKPLMEGVKNASSMLSIMEKVMSGLMADKAKCEAALSAGIFAADIAYDKVKSGASFRDAYRQAAAQLGSPLLESLKKKYIDSALKRYDIAYLEPLIAKAQADASAKEAGFKAAIGRLAAPGRP